MTLADEDGSNGRPVEVEERLAKIFSPEDEATFQNIRTSVANMSEYERLYQEVLMKLENDEVLDGFRVEFAGLHHSYLKSFEGESRLLRKCLELQDDIYACALKAHTAEQLTAGDKQTIGTLKAEVDKTRKKASETKGKESTLKEKIYKIRQEVQELERAAHEPIEAAGQEATLQKLQQALEMVLKEKDAVEYKMSTKQHDIAGVERRLLKLKESKAMNDAELQRVRDGIEAKQDEVEQLTKRKKTREDELRAVRDDMTARTIVLSERQAKIDKLSEENRQHGLHTRKATEEAESVMEEYQTLCRQVQNVNAALQDCNEENDVLQRRVKEAISELRSHEAEVQASHKQCVKDQTLVEALQRRNAVAEQKRLEAQQQRDSLQEDLRRKERELEQLKRAVDSDEKQLAAVRHEQDILHQGALSAQQQQQKNAAWLAEKNSQLRHLEHELAAYEEHIQAQNEEVYKCTKECVAYEEQTRAHMLTCASVMSEVHIREQQTAETLEQVRGVELRIKQQKSMLDSITADRNAYAKHYAQLRQELVEMGKKFKLVLVQIKHLQDEIARRERDTLVEEEHLLAMGKQQKEIESHIASIQRRVDKKNHFVEQLSAEIHKLSDVVMVAEEETTRQRRRCREVCNERDLLGDKVVKRNAELITWYEKMQSQQGLLQRGEAMYNERVRHIEQLEYQTALLSQQLEQMKAFVARLPDLRLLINNTTRELNREKVKVRALLDECKRPLNLHPDHELSWSEPETFEVAECVRELQRQLVQRRQELQAKEQEIRAREDDYMRAKATVAKQPGPEVAEQLTAYQDGLVKKKGQLKQMRESLQYFREQTELYRTRHDELRGQLSCLAKEYAAGQEHSRAEEAMPADGAMCASSTSSQGLVYAGFFAPPLAADGSPVNRGTRQDSDPIGEGATVDPIITTGKTSNLGIQEGMGGPVSGVS